MAGHSWVFSYVSDQEYIKY